MEEKKLTDEEIVKALKHCSGLITAEACKDCPLNLSNGGDEACYYDDTILEKYALDLINRQKAEIERMTEYNANLNGMCLEFIDKNAELQKQVEVLTAEKENLYFLNKNLEDYIDNHEPIWKRNTEQAVKDTAKEICDLILEHWEKKQFVECDWLRVAIAEKYGVEVE